MEGREKKPLPFFGNGAEGIGGFAAISMKRVGGFVVDEVEKDDWNLSSSLIATCELSMAVGALPDILASALVFALAVDIKRRALEQRTSRQSPKKAYHIVKCSCSNYLPKSKPFDSRYQINTNMPIRMSARPKRHSFTSPFSFQHRLQC